LKESPYTSSRKAYTASPLWKKKKEKKKKKKEKKKKENRFSLNLQHQRSFQLTLEGGG